MPLRGSTIGSNGKRNQLSRLKAWCNRRHASLIGCLLCEEVQLLANGQALHWHSICRDGRDKVLSVLTTRQEDDPILLKVDHRAKLVQDALRPAPNFHIWHVVEGDIVWLDDLIKR